MTTTQASDRIALSISAWSEGFDYEMRFWHGWISSRGLQWPDDFAKRLDPDSQLDGILAKLLRDCSSPRVLDVGAGPLTVIQKRLGPVNLKLQACDPLASMYNLFLRTAGIVPLVETRFANAEDLSAFYDENSFDIVTCRNALDHSFDPLRGIIEMLRVVKVGGKVFLKHMFNEAERENYIGFHQYNFDEDNNRFIIWNKNERLDIATLLPIEATIETSREGQFLEVTITKKGAFPLQEDDRFRARVRELLGGIIGFYIDRAIEKNSSLMS